MHSEPVHYFKEQKLGLSHFGPSKAIASSKDRLAGEEANWTPAIPDASSRRRLLPKPYGSACALREHVQGIHKTLKCG